MVVVDISVRTDPGRDPAKQINEDAYGERATALGHLAFVCDGMGGHENGREASTLAVATILDWFASTPAGGSPRDVLRGAIEEANRRVFRIGGAPVAALGHAGSTIVAILVHAGGTEVAHVGDSRAFLVHGGAIFQVTRDHSMVQQMVDAQLLTPEQAAHHPEANKITRALGIAPDVEVELRAQPLVHAAGDAFVLCSDGLTDLVSAQEILDVVQGAPPRAGGERSGRHGQRARRTRQRHGHDRPPARGGWRRHACRSVGSAPRAVWARPRPRRSRRTVRPRRCRCRSSSCKAASTGASSPCTAGDQDAGGRTVAAAARLWSELRRPRERAHSARSGASRPSPERARAVEGEPPAHRSRAPRRARRARKRRGPRLSPTSSIAVGRTTTQAPMAVRSRSGGPRIRRSRSCRRTSMAGRRQHRPVRRARSFVVDRGRENGIRTGTDRGRQRGGQRHRRSRSGAPPRAPSSCRTTGSSSSTWAPGRRPPTARRSRPGQLVPFDFRTMFALNAQPLPLSHPALLLLIMDRGAQAAPPGHLIIGREPTRASLVLHNPAVSGQTRDRDARPHDGGRPRLHQRHLPGRPAHPGQPARAHRPARHHRLRAGAGPGGLARRHAAGPRPRREPGRTYRRAGGAALRLAGGDVGVRTGASSGGHATGDAASGPPADDRRGSGRRRRSRHPQAPHGHRRALARRPAEQHDHHRAHPRQPDRGAAPAGLGAPRGDRQGGERPLPRGQGLGQRHLRPRRAHRRGPARRGVERRADLHRSHAGGPQHHRQPGRRRRRWTVTRRGPASLPTRSKAGISSSRCRIATPRGR